MNNKFITLIMALMVSVRCWGQEAGYSIPQFKIGDNRSGPSDHFSDAETASILLKAGAYGLEGFTNFGDGDVYYLLMRDIVGKFDLPEEEYLGGWPLGSASACSTDPSCESAWWAGRWSEDELLEQEVIGLYPQGMSWTNSLKPSTSMMGCMLENAPLRYGDIENDGQIELIVLMANYYSVDFIVFSPQQGKTIFAAKLDHNDAISNETAGEDLLHKIPHEERYQYWSRYWSRTGVSTSMTVGYKSFAKLFFGDYDKDGAFDILVWRKLYEPYKVTASEKGFQLKQETFGHYELANGEYQLRETEGVDIQRWLTEKHLSWQDGYPSKSECPGEEGELIPEMHDPLLNDPEVLK